MNNMNFSNKFVDVFQLKIKIGRPINKRYDVSWNIFSSINKMFTNISFLRRSILRYRLFLSHCNRELFIVFYITLRPFLFDDVEFDINFINLQISVVVFDSVHLLYHLLFVPFSLMCLELSISVDV